MIHKIIKEITNRDIKIETIEENRLVMIINTIIDVLPKDMRVKDKVSETKEETKGEIKEELKEEIIDRIIGIKIEINDMNDLREPKDHKGSKELLDRKDIIQEAHKIKIMKEEIINMAKEEIGQISKIEVKEETIDKPDKTNLRTIPESEDSPNKKNPNITPESDNLKRTLLKPKEMLINSILN